MSLIGKACRMSDEQFQTKLRKLAEQTAKLRRRNKIVYRGDTKLERKCFPWRTSQTKQDNVIAGPDFTELQHRAEQGLPLTNWRELDNGSFGRNKI